MFLLGSQSGYVGVVLTSCLNMVGMMQWGLRQSAVMENTMTSVERIAEYGRLKSEAELVSEYATYELVYLTIPPQYITMNHAFFHMTF